ARPVLPLAPRLPSVRLLPPSVFIVLSSSNIMRGSCLLNCDPAMDESGRVLILACVCALLAMSAISGYGLIGIAIVSTA
ncbi:MAG: hypothetical protein CFH05_00894, partial [Alphaproteobacteria bacterium MarineAlpha3_Bin4]